MIFMNLHKTTSKINSGLQTSMQDLRETKEILKDSYRNRLIYFARTGRAIAGTLTCSLFSYCILLQVVCIKKKSEVILGFQLVSLQVIEVILPYVNTYSTSKLLIKIPNDFGQRIESFGNLFDAFIQYDIEPVADKTDFPKFSGNYNDYLT